MLNLNHYRQKVKAANGRAVPGECAHFRIKHQISGVLKLKIIYKYILLKRQWQAECGSFFTFGVHVQMKQSLWPTGNNMIFPVTADFHGLDIVEVTGLNSRQVAPCASYFPD